VTGLPWKPTQAELDATLKGEGHLCLIANVYADGDGAEVLGGGTFDVVNNPHHGQRNITLLAAARSEERSMEFQLMPDPGGGETVVRIEQIDPAQVLGAGERWLLRSHRKVVLDRDREQLVVVHKDEHFPIEVSEDRVRGRISAGEFGELDRKGLVPAFRDPLVAKVEFATPKADIGALQAFEIVQRNDQGEALGGLRFLSLVTG
jgi:hypothetical protein